MLSKIKNQFWFPVNPLCFGLVRLSFYAILFFYYWRWNSLNPMWGEDMANSPFWEPQSFFIFLEAKTWLALKPNLIYSAWVISMLSCALGVGFRLAAPVAFISFVYLTGLPINFGKVHHSNHMPAVMLGLLAVVGQAGALSVDAFIAKNFNFRKPRPEIYGWFFMTGLMYMGLVYLNSGIQKWITGGWQWGNNESMATIILTRPTVTELGLWVASSDWIPGVLAWSTLLFQPASVLMPFYRWARLFFIPTMFMMHVGTHLLLGAHGAFTPYNICYILMVPWLLPERMMLEKHP